MALLLGFILVAGLGILHHYGLRLIRAVKPHTDEKAQAAIIVTFVGLLVLHSVEILLYAFAYRGILAWGALGGLGGAFEGSWQGLIYFSGINFATLGYTQIETAGSIRMVSMMQSLGGFMVLTWSATFLYAVCERGWKE